jgi:hypothetical protein
MTKRRAHFFSVHEHVPGGHGGNRRVTQICSFLASQGFDVRYNSLLAAPAVRTRGESFANLLAGALPFSGATPRRFASPRGLFRVGYLRRMPIDEVRAGDLCVFESTLTLSTVLFERVRARGAHVCVFPPNLDSLSPDTVDPVSGAMSPSWFGSELAAIRKADLVCCISREEQWLLGLYGVESHFLPYYPAADVVGALKRIRAARVGTQKDVILALGTAHNIPTRKGMEELVRFWQQHLSATGTLTIAGYGTEQLAPLAAASVSVLGTLSADRLRDLTVHARACVIHQVPTTGFLTRIPELLIAGVPIIANSTGSRSHHNVHGVLAYEQMAEIPSLLSAAEQLEPEMVPPPTAALAAVAAALRDLAAP